MKEEIKNEIILSSEFTPFQLQIDKFKKVNKNTVFNYDDPKGNKEARSHVFKLRTTKKPIVEAHEKAKAEILKKGRELDGFKNNLISQIDDMIDVHAEPLKIAKEKQEKKDAEEKEAKRVEDEAEVLRIKIEMCHESGVLLNDIFDQKAVMKKQEEEQKAKQDELDKQAEEQEEERKRIEDEERIKREEKEKADKEAETKRIEAETKLKEAETKRIADIQAVKDKAKKDKENAEKKRLNDIQAEKDRAEAAKKQSEKEKQDAIDKLKREQEEKERLEKKRIADEKAEADRLKEIEAKKSANKAHQKRINNAIVARMVECGADEKAAKKIISWTVKGLINNMAITY